jgi:hypothetical protein
MKRRTHALFKKLRKVIHRRDHTVLEQDLVPKQEFVVFVRCAQQQIDLFGIPAWCHTLRCFLVQTLGVAEEVVSSLSGLAPGRADTG